MALILKIYGYYYTLEGKNLFLDISDIFFFFSKKKKKGNIFFCSEATKKNILNKRYSTTISADKVDKIINDIIIRFEDIIKKDSPFDIKLDLPHTENVRKFSILNRPEKPKIVYIYENENMVQGS